MSKVKLNPDAVLANDQNGVNAVCQSAQLCALLTCQFQFIFLASFLIDN